MHNKALVAQMPIEDTETTTPLRSELEPLAPMRRRGLLTLLVRAPMSNPQPADVPLSARRALRKQISLYFLSFIAFVALPSLAAQIYLAFLASDQYVAEVRLAVRLAGPDSSDAVKSALSSLAALSGVGSSVGGQDSYIITSYVHSRAVIDDLGADLNLREIFRRPQADFWARLKADASAEDLLDYWNTMVSSNVDGPSGIVTIKVRAFLPADALALCRRITELSESLANSVSARMRQDLMRRSEEEVRRSEGLVRAALEDMRLYREKEGFLNPISAAESTGKLLMQSIGDKIAIESELFVGSRAMSIDAPTVQVLKQRLLAVDKQIDQLKSQLTGSSLESKAISGSLLRFEEIELRRQFAEKLYSMAQDSLAQARRKAERQNIYVSVFVPPALPQDAKFPERLSLAVLIPLGLLVVWGIFALLAAAVEDHRL